MKSVLLAALAAMAALAPATAGAAVYVSPTGDDANTGTLSSPVKTIVKGVQLAPADGKVLMAPGVYPAESRSLLRPALLTTVTGQGAVVGGLNLKGAQNLAFDGLTFTGSVVIDSRTDAGTDPSSNVTVSNSMLSAPPNATCIVIKSRAANITVSGNRIGPCFNGIVLPARSSTTLDSSNVTVTSNVIGPVEGDCGQVSDTNGWIWSSNVCKDARDRDPSDGLEHNDGIQVPTGGRNGQILNNVISTLSEDYPSAGAQLQAGNHGSSNITMEGNAIGNTGSVSVQVGAVTGFQAIGNTGCYSQAGIGMWIRGGGSPSPPTDAIARYNVFQDIQAIEGAAWQELTGNADC